MLFAKFVNWLKRWDRYRTIIIFLVLDTLQAQVQLLYFLYWQIWEAKTEFLLHKCDTIKSSDKSGFNQYPSYDTFLYYFTVVGALVSRVLINWLVFDGISTGIRSHVRAGVIGSICTTFYIVIGGIVLWIEQYEYFHLARYHLAAAVLGFILYGLLTAWILYILWHDENKGDLQGYSRNVSASLLLICGVFVGFVQFQLLIWFVAVVWYQDPDGKFRPLTDRFPV